MKSTSCFAEAFRMKLFMQNATTGSHPLHIAGAYFTLAATAVFVRYTAAPGNGYRFKALVRVYIHATRVVGWSYRPWLIVVKHQKRAQVVPQILTNKVTYLKAIAYHMGCGGGTEVFYFFVIHAFLFVVYGLGFIVSVVFLFGVYCLVFIVSV
jgi:hypothetical protein